MKIGIILPTNSPMTADDILNLTNKVTEVIDYKTAKEKGIDIPSYNVGDRYVIIEVKKKSFLEALWPAFGKVDSKGKKEITKKSQKFRK